MIVIVVSDHGGNGADNIADIGGRGGDCVTVLVKVMMVGGADSSGGY